MQWVIESDASIHLIRRYDGGVIEVGERRLARPCIVTPLQVFEDWDGTGIAQVTEAGLEPVLALSPEIVLLGEGERGAMAPRGLTGALARRQVALESMGLGAACRTYNILAHDRRRVAAVLFPSG